MIFDDEVVARVRKNIFVGAQEAIENWNDFPWHTGPKGDCDSDKNHSSQALAVDVFGTLKVNNQRDTILNRLFRRVGLPDGKGWNISLEYLDECNPLGERRLTQVDAVAISDTSIIFFECKFTETDGGICRQTLPIASGANEGKIQCNGNYMMQRNPISEIAARCALSGKGIRYWEFIPRIFTYNNDQDFMPCPFRFSKYQWMRNLTNCYAIAELKRLKPAVFVIYADAPTLPMSRHVQSSEWLDFNKRLRKDAITFDTLSYQELIDLACETDQSAEAPWTRLKEWVERKIDKACKKV